MQNCKQKASKQLSLCFVYYLVEREGTLTMASTSRITSAAIACLAIAGSSNAFTTGVPGKSAVKSFRNPTTALFVDGPEDGTTVTSARKEIGYDAASGRFFETDIDKSECIPDDEYCVVDKDTGDMVRLTLEEKERIFLDALQVSRWTLYDYYALCFSLKY